MGAELPYNGTSGWAGSDTSKERSYRQDGNGETKAKQLLVMAVLGSKKSTGVTWKELADMHLWHHGQASGALSVMHLAGKICRLTERRGRCAVYVLPQFVDGRETSAHGSIAKRQSVESLRTEILTELEHWFNTNGGFLEAEMYNAFMYIVKTTGTEQVGKK